MERKLEVRGKERKLKVKYASGKTSTIYANSKLIPHLVRGLYEGLIWVNIIYQGFEGLRPAKEVNVIENDKVRIIF